MNEKSIVRDCAGNPVQRPAKGFFETDEGTYDVVRWVDSLPKDDPHGGLSLISGYAVGISGHKLPQTWCFFEGLEPALVFGRAARMSKDVHGYGVYRAMSETRYNADHGRDGNFLWLLPEPLDRRDDEGKRFRAWADGVDRESGHWPPDVASWSKPGRTLLSGRINAGAALLPVRFRRLPDGRSTVEIINALAQKLRSAGKDVVQSDFDGEWTGGAEIRAELGERYGHVSVDAICYSGKIRADLAEYLHRLTWHAGGRMWAEGYEGSITGGEGACTYWGAHFLKNDAAAVLLATLDLLANGNSAIAEWYLSSTCKGLCREHRDPTVNACPSRWCGLADSSVECTCPCKGEHHGTGSNGMPRGSLALNWQSIPATPGTANDSFVPREIS